MNLTAMACLGPIFVSVLTFVLSRFRLEHRASEEPDELIDQATIPWANTIKRRTDAMKGKQVTHTNRVQILQGDPPHFFQPKFFDIGRMADYCNAPPAAFNVHGVCRSAYGSALKLAFSTQRLCLAKGTKRKSFGKSRLVKTDRGDCDIEKRNKTLIVRYSRNSQSHCAQE